MPDHRVRVKQMLQQLAPLVYERRGKSLGKVGAT